MSDAIDEFPISPDGAELLLDLAEVSIRACLDGTSYPGPDVERLPTELLRPCAAFVTLHVAGQLNGCIGNLESDDPIGVCVGELARKAAFEDPRLPPLGRADLARLHLDVALLSPRRDVPATTRGELLAHLVPGTHGLVIVAGRRRAVFLPSVWAQLPAADDFVDALLRKAELPPDRWPDDLRAEVFTTSNFDRHLG